MRIFAYRADFFIKPGWKWNVFDFLLVFLQIGEEVVTAMVYHNSTWGATHIEIIKNISNTMINKRKKIYTICIQSI